MVPPIPRDRSSEGRPFARVPAPLAVIPAVFAVSIAGCSSARYDVDYAKAVTEFRTRAEFSRLQEKPIELAEGRVRLQPPKELPDAISENGADPRFPAGEDGEARKIDARRLRPPFLEGLPGWAAAYEGVYGPANGKLPATLSISLVPAAEMKRTELEEEVLARLKKEEAFEGAKPEWQGREVTDRAAATKTWRVLEVRGPQRIDRFAGAKEPQYEPVETAVAIWLSAERDQEFCTVLSWRVPDEIKESVKLDELAPLVARSLATVPPAK